jgi:hypothetical protein
MEKVNCQFLPQELFPTPVGIYNFGSSNHDLNCKLVEDSLNEQQLYPQGISYSNFKGWHSHFGIEKKYQSFEKLKSIIQSSVQHYCNYYGYKSNIICYHLWVNLNCKSSYNRVHTHGNSYLTGVYYPAKSIVNDQPTFNYENGEENFLGNRHSPKYENGGSLYFLSPSFSEGRTLIKTEHNQYNTDTYHMNPISSVLLVFPSYLLHGVEPLHEDCTRISISFKVKLENNG